MKDYLFAKQLIYICLESYQDLDYLGALMKSIDNENLESTWLHLSNGDIDKWKGFTRNIEYPIQKLIVIAKKNNPDYNQIQCNIDKDLTDTSYDVSKIFYEIFKYNYKYESKNLWYYYDYDLYQWKLDIDYLHMKNTIGGDLRQFFISKCFYFWKEMGDTNDKDLRKLYDKLGTIASKIALNLKKMSFISAVITESKCLFIDE